MNKEYRSPDGTLFHFNSTGLTEQKSVVSEKETEMRQELKELFQPKLKEGNISGVGALSTGDPDDEELVDKPAGPHILSVDNDQRQQAYEKPVSQLPTGIGQNNPTTGEPHFNGEMWKTNNNDIDDSNVVQMLKDFENMGGKITDDTADQIKSLYNYNFNRMVKKDKYAAQQETLANLLKDPRYADNLDQLGGVVSKSKYSSLTNTKENIPHIYQMSTCDNDVETWWPGNEPIGKHPEELEQVAEDIVDPDGHMKAVNLKEENVDEVWIDSNTTPENNGWPINKFSKKKDTRKQHQKEADKNKIEEDEELNEICHRLHYYSKAIDSGKGAEIVSKEFNRRLSEHYHYNKIMNEIEENRYVSKSKYSSLTNTKENIPHIHQMSTDNNRFPLKNNERPESSVAAANYQKQKDLEKKLKDKLGMTPNDIDEARKETGPSPFDEKPDDFIKKPVNKVVKTQFDAGEPFDVPIKHERDVEDIDEDKVVSEAYRRFCDVVKQSRILG